MIYIQRVLIYIFVKIFILKFWTMVGWEQKKTIFWKFQIYILAKSKNTNLIDVQYLQKVVFSFEKGSNGQNHSSSGSHNPIKKSPLPRAKFPIPPPLSVIWKTVKPVIIATYFLLIDVALSIISWKCCKVAGFHFFRLRIQLFIKRLIVRIANGFW